MSGKYATPLHLEPRPSRRLGRLLAAIHATALGILPLSQLPPPAIAVIAPFIVYSYLHHHRLQVRRRAARAITALRWDAGNHWRLHLRSGNTVAAYLLPRVFLQPWLVILHFRTEQGRTASVVLLSDMLEPDDFRKLRVRLLTEMKQLADPGSR